MDKFLQVLGVQGEHHALVIQATTPTEEGEPDWMAVMTVCDLANLNTNNIKEILKDLRKRIADKDDKVAYLGLLLLESLFKNGGKMMHQLVAHNDELVKLIGRAASSGGEKASECGRKLVLAMHLFSHGRRDLKPLQNIATPEEMAEYKKMTVTEDWRQVTGPGSQGVRSDPRSYQEISPRAPENTHVIRRDNKRETQAEPLRARIDPATVSPRQRKVPAEIQAIWDMVSSFKRLLSAAERDAQVLEEDEIHKQADELVNSRTAVNKAAGATTNSTTMSQLLELNDALNTVIGTYQRMCGRAASSSSIDGDEFKDAVPCASDSGSPVSVPRLDIEQVLGEPSPVENPDEEDEEYVFNAVAGGGINDDVPEDQR
eukprot:TRINITY_DN42365_c0_g1_i1.p1 TRINITY_DN42365_c0_g1~~TRINITY_DN42365_c0_g1_i1.p1  ORF type:complete len:384 (+),score=107.58 TRINITY_DN42365_c0_g1_i1:35-1153(+)